MMQCAAAYLFNGRIVIVPQRETTAGAWISDGAPEVCETRNPQGLGETVLRALARSERQTPHPVDWRQIVDPAPRASGAKSRTAFMASAKLVVIEGEGERLNLRACRNLGPKQGFEETGEPRAIDPAHPRLIGMGLLSAFDAAS